MIRLLAVAILCCIAMTDANAQLFKRRYKKTKEPRPKVLLVQLPTYHEKIKLYKSKNNTKGVNEWTNGAQFVSNKLVKDFNKNFTFCDYYFFYDSNSNALLQEQFGGIFFDKNMHPVSTIPIKPGDTAYQIIYYGEFIADDAQNPKNTGRKNDPYDGTYTLTAGTKRLVVLNHKFKNMKHPAPNGSDVFYNRLNWRYPKKVVYSSAYDIYYAPFVKFMNKKMIEYYIGSE